MRLLISIINDPNLITDILEEFYQEDIKGATVMNSMGMAHIMAYHVPFFSRFAELGEEPQRNKTIFALVETDEIRDKAVRAIERITGDLEKSETGIVITVPIDYYKGFANLNRDEVIEK